MSFKTYYQKLGLNEFPFNTFTTEDELKVAKKIFVSQGEYDPILDGFKDGRNIILLGERGSGKTAILEDFKRYLKSKKLLITTINDFSTLSKTPSNEEVYKLLISEFTITLLESIGNNPLKLWKLSKEERVTLSYLLKTLIPPVTLNTLKDKISALQVPFWSTWLKKGYNAIRGPLNFGGTVAQNLTYQYLLKHYSFLPALENDSQIQEYFPELKLNVTFEFFDQDISLRLLKRLGNISQKLGFEKPTIFLDRLDEDSRLNNDAELISEFIAPMLTNTNLLSISEFQLIFFVWSTPFRYIAELVRTQKYYCPNLEWRREDLEKLLNSRLLTYSKGSITSYVELFDETVSDEDRDKLFVISNSNPRDLIHIFKMLFEEGYRKESSKYKFSKEIVNQTLERFVLDFNYYEYYPRKSNARANSMDVYSFAAHLLKLDNPEFSKNKLNEMAGIGSSIHNYVIGMERIGLIKNIGQDKGFVSYKIKDPKIIYCLKNNLELKKKS